jgi:hypothetical protein
MNDVAMNIHVQVFYGHMFSILLNIYLRMELVGYLVTLCVTYSEGTKVFSKVVTIVYRVQISPYSH